MSLYICPNLFSYFLYINANVCYSITEERLDRLSQNYQNSFVLIYASVEDCNSLVVWQKVANVTYMYWSRRDKHTIRACPNETCEAQ